MEHTATVARQIEQAGQVRFLWRLICRSATFSLSYSVPIHLSALFVDPIINHEVENGSLARAVNAASCIVQVGEWRQEFDGVGVLFFLDGLYGAVIGALMYGRSTSFFCLDDPASGRITQTSQGGLEVSMQDGGAFEVSGFELLAATVGAIMEVAEFLSDEGYAAAARTILVSDVARHPAAATPTP